MPAARADGVAANKANVVAASKKQRMSTSIFLASVLCFTYATACNCRAAEEHDARAASGHAACPQPAFLSRLPGMGRMLSRFWQWLEYDPVALAVLLIGVGSIAVLMLGILTAISSGNAMPLLPTNCRRCPNTI